VREKDGGYWSLLCMESKERNLKIKGVESSLGNVQVFLLKGNTIFLGAMNKII